MRVQVPPSAPEPAVAGSDIVLRGERLEVFGLEIFEGERLDLLSELINRLDRGVRTFLVTLNAQIALRAKKDPVYREILKNSDLIVVDGVGVSVLLSVKYLKKVRRYPGIELMVDLLALSKLKGWKVYLLGAKDVVVEKLADMLSKEGVKVVGYHHGYFDGKGPVDEIVKSEPDLVFVAMGVPKQEEWIFSNLDEFSRGVFMGVGGSFDVLTGFRKRAPTFMRRLGMEWLYRFFSEPRKRWKVPFQILEFSMLGLIDILRRVFR